MEHSFRSIGTTVPDRSEYAAKALIRSILADSRYFPENFRLKKRGQGEKRNRPRIGRRNGFCTPKSVCDSLLGFIDRHYAVVHVDCVFSGCGSFKSPNTEAIPAHSLRGLPVRLRVYVPDQRPRTSTTPMDGVRHRSGTSSPATTGSPP